MGTQVEEQFRHLDVEAGEGVGDGGARWRDLATAGLEDSRGGTVTKAGKAGRAGRASRTLLTLGLLAADSAAGGAVAGSSSPSRCRENWCSRPRTTACSSKGTTLGWEAQARFTFGRFSVGAGYQRSTVFKSDAAVGDITATLSVGFVEPRYVLGVFGNVAAPYVAARFGYGGLLMRSSERPGALDREFVHLRRRAGVIFQVASARRHRRRRAVLRRGLHRGTGQCGVLPDATRGVCWPLLGCVLLCLRPAGAGRVRRWR